MKSQCSKIRQLVCVEYDFNDNSQNRIQEIEEHLKICEECRNYVENLKKVVVYYQKYEIHVDEECSIRILKKLGLYKG